MKPLNTAPSNNVGTDALKGVSDTVLRALFRDGDEAAFQHLYFNHYQLLFQYGWNISKDDHVSNDAIQDLFSDLWHSRKNLSAAVSVKAYLLSSLRRRVLVKLKQIRRKQVLALELFTLHPDIEFSPEMI